MRTNWKLPLGSALFGAVVSLIAGLAGGNSFGTVLLRLFFSALAFAVLGLLVGLLLRRYFPELSRAPGRPAEESSGRVDIIIDEELPDGGAAEQARPPAARGSIGGPGEGGEGDLLPEEFGGPSDEAAADGLEAVSPEVWETAPAGGSGDAGASRGGDGLPGTDALRQAQGGAPVQEEELEEADFPSGGPAAETPAELFGEEQPGVDALPDIDSLSPRSQGREEPQPRKSAPTRREMRQAEIEEAVKDHDPAELARAVRTMWKKDQ